MLCTDCTTMFFRNPVNFITISISIIFAIISLILVNKKNISIKTKQLFIHLHIFFLVLPLLYYILFNGCHNFFSGCNKSLAIIVMILLSGVIATITGMILAPLLFIRQFTKKSISNKNNNITEFINKASKELEIKEPKINIVNEAKPFAFSYVKSSIFISLGLIELLSKKELESVILHELYHVKNSSPFFKFSTFLIRLSPLATFTSFIDDLNKEEINADNFSIKFQKTDKYLKKAKIKINKYYNYIF